MSADAEQANGGLYHVVLIGFHHKKGCVVEYAYPPLSDSSKADAPGDASASSLPKEWKFLPSLAMPDGAHNFAEDVVYFHLPPIPNKLPDGINTRETVYCVSYCKQVDASLLSQRDENITRGTVQKSVVILSKIPAFGLIHAKLQLPMITDAFLENFHNKEILKELYNQINATLNISDESHLFFGLSVRKILKNFNHNLLVIFKLILLEKRVIFYATPASELVDTVLTLLSLFPRMIDTGLSHCTGGSEKIEPLKNSLTSDGGNSIDNSMQTDSHGSSSDSTFEVVQVHSCVEAPSDNSGSVDEIVLGSSNLDESAVKPPNQGQSISRAGSMMSRVAGKLGFRGVHSSANLSTAKPIQSPDSLPPFDHLDPEHDDDDVYMLKLGNARLEMDVGSPERLATKSHEKGSISRNSIVQSRKKDVLIRSPFDVDEYGFPLSVFVDGNLCLPYISLQHHDLIQQHSPNHGFVVGATNILFKTRKDLSDVIVDVEAGEIIFHDPNLQRQLSLSAADLRFAEHIATNILEHEAEDFFNAATEWKGGDEWLRSLFAEYLHRMLCVSSKETDDRKIQDFNEAFIVAWKQTKNFQIWEHGNHKVLEDILEWQHPFHGQYSVSDIRLRLHHRLQNSEQGRKLEGAISNANDTIINTGRYIGNTLGSAKSSLSSWFSDKLQTNKS